VAGEPLTDLAIVIHTEREITINTNPDMSNEITTNSMSARKKLVKCKHPGVAVSATSAMEKAAATQIEGSTVASNDADEPDPREVKELDCDNFFDLGNFGC